LINEIASDFAPRNYTVLNSYFDKDEVIIAALAEDAVARSAATDINNLPNLPMDLLATSTIGSFILPIMLYGNTPVITNNIKPYRIITTTTEPTIAKGIFLPGFLISSAIVEICSKLTKDTIINPK